MRRLLAFLAVTADGYHESPDQEFDWHNAPETEDSGYPTASGFRDLDDPQADEADTLLFGRVTYELMAAYWPTPAAKEAEPRIAARMNDLPKLVASRTLRRAEWANSRLLSGDVAAEVAALKRQPGKDIMILGSSTLTGFLLEHGLVDELRLLVNPIVLGAGRSVLAGVRGRVPLVLTRSTTFGPGNFLLRYEAASSSRGAAS